MRKKYKKDCIEFFILVFVLIGSFLLFSRIDMLEKIVEFSKNYEQYEVDEIFSTALILPFYFIWFSIRKWKESIKVNKEICQKNIELEKYLDEIKILKGIIPICMHCKKIRNEKGAWEPLEKYISEHSDANFSHGICSECFEKYYPEKDD